ncbi:MAG: thioredoxin domain-containing protein [Actinobacteria bacterium]|nr:thioredoxin domain-containing protein [Actinomycetota bacterium]
MVVAGAGVLSAIGVGVGLAVATTRSGEGSPALVAPDRSLRGDPQGKVTLVEFMDFQCPHCRTAVPLVKRALDAVPKGVRFQVRFLPVVAPISQGKALASLALCARAQGDDAYWRFYDGLIEALEQPGRLDLPELAARLGVAWAPLQACHERGDANRALEADTAAARFYGLRGTPTFFLNGLELPLSELSNLATILRQAVAAAQ